MDRCTTCVMPINDGESFCDECKTYVPLNVDWEQKEQEFRKLVDDYRGKGEKYDFVVPLTGGKDSSFVLYYMTKVLNANVVAFTWDNDLIREAAWKNINNAIKATGVDHVIIKYHSDNLKKLLRSMFKTVGKMCFCPTFLGLSVFPFAIKKKIPLIITGFSEGQRELDHSFTLPDQNAHKQDFITFYNFWKNAFSRVLEIHEPQLKDEIIDHLFADLEPYAQPDSEIERYPVMVPLSNYVNWTNIDDLKEVLEKEINYKKAAKATAHTSCVIEPVKGYLEYKRKGTEIVSEISNLVRCGAITRESGLDDVEEMYLEGTIPKAEIKEFCKFLDITDEEFKHYSGPEDGDEVPRVPDEKISTIAWLMGIERFNAIFK